MIREIVNIDKEKCNGCGLCIPNCQEGALQIIDGKAVLISELMCDGLGACLGHCPEGAISIEKREAQPYDEVLVLSRMLQEGKNIVIAHLLHLKEHNQTEFLKQALEYLKQNKEYLKFDLNEVLARVNNSEDINIHLKMEMNQTEQKPITCGCPGSLSQNLGKRNENQIDEKFKQESQLTNWPVQMHLINPSSANFRNADVLLSADCVAYAFGNFHQSHLKGKSLIIACPKLDSNKEIYIKKLVTLIDESEINSLTVMKMQVPCCTGLLQIAQISAAEAKRKVDIKSITVGIEGNVLS